MSLLKDRLRPWSAVGPYAALALVAAFAGVVEHGAAGPRPVELALCALAALWMLGLYSLRPAWRGRPRVMGVFLAGLLVIMLILTVFNPWFAFYTPVCYLFAFRIIGWPAELWFIAGVGVVAGNAQAS